MECDRQELTIGYGLAHMHYKSKAWRPETGFRQTF
jgi:hypothetical protein